MILLWGLSGDGPLAAVRDRLRRMDAPVVFLDQEAVLDCAIELTTTGEVTGTLWMGGRTLDLGTVSAVYLRPYDVRQVPALRRAGPRSVEWRHALALEGALLTWADLTRALVVNPPAAMAANNAKPYQAAQIAALGFQVPDTLLTTDPEAALAFLERHREVVYKSISGVRSVVSRLRTEHLGRMDDLRWCPTQFQEYVPGPDYRVHLVGDEVFACEVKSAADDYRYAALQGAEVAIRPCVLPAECGARCRALARAMDLAVAGVDLRRAPSGEWCCFEVNPSPAFTYYQQFTGQPIDEAIARLLANAARREG